MTFEEFWHETFGQADGTETMTIWKSDANTYYRMKDNYKKFLKEES